MSAVKFLIIGFGYIGNRHAEIISGHPECELIAICDIDPKKSEVVQKYNVPFYTNWKRFDLNLTRTLMQPVSVPQTVCTQSMH